MQRTRTWVAAVAIAGLAVTLVAVAVPPLHFAHRSPGLHLALQTSEATIGLVVAFLVSGRFWRRLRSEDLLLFASLAALARRTSCSPRSRP